MAEIAEYVRAGQKPPGIKDVDDAAVMRPASTSDSERPLKPWEVQRPTQEELQRSMPSQE